MEEGEKEEEEEEKERKEEEEDDPLGELRPVLQDLPLPVLPWVEQPNLHILPTPILTQCMVPLSCPSLHLSPLRVFKGCRPEEVLER